MKEDVISDGLVSFLFFQYHLDIYNEGFTVFGIRRIWVFGLVYFLPNHPGLQEPSYLGKKHSGHEISNSTYH